METVSRGKFLKTLGLSSKALMAYYCLGALTACSKEDDDIDPDNSNTGQTGNTSSGITGTTSGSSLDFTIDLKNNNYSKLSTDGEFVIVGDVLVANAGGTFIAVQKNCTHAGTQLQYRKSQNDIYCNNHGSEFSTNGAVEKSPATESLKVYKTTHSAVNSTLKVTA
jgi:cytochrome b6-f complex iron-sulfur subunit